VLKKKKVVCTTITVRSSWFTVSTVSAVGDGASDEEATEQASTKQASNKKLLLLLLIARFHRFANSFLCYIYSY
jgi:hypothetical protein